MMSNLPVFNQAFADKAFELIPDAVKVSALRKGRNSKYEGYWEDKENGIWYLGYVYVNKNSPTEYTRKVEKWKPKSVEQYLYADPTIKSMYCETAFYQYDINDEHRIATGNYFPDTEEGKQQAIALAKEMLAPRLDVMSVLDSKEFEEFYYETLKRLSFIGGDIGGIKQFFQRKLDEVSHDSKA